METANRDDISPSLPCANLENTTGTQCIYEGPYKWDKRGMPSCAYISQGDKEGPTGTTPHSLYLVCDPAVRFRDESMHANDIQRQGLFGKLIDEQHTCTKFKERC